MTAGLPPPLGSVELPGKTVPEPLGVVEATCESYHLLSGQMCAQPLDHDGKHAALDDGWDRLEWSRIVEGPTREPDRRLAGSEAAAAVMEATLKDAEEFLKSVGVDVGPEAKVRSVTFDLDAVRVERLVTRGPRGQVVLNEQRDGPVTTVDTYPYKREGE